MKHILVIDDDVYIGNMLEEALSKEGYKVSRAYSGTEALLLLSTTKPDLILLDLMLKLTLITRWSFCLMARQIILQNHSR